MRYQELRYLRVTKVEKLERTFCRKRTYCPGVLMVDIVIRCDTLLSVARCQQANCCMLVFLFYLHLRSVASFSIGMRTISIC